MLSNEGKGKIIIAVKANGRRPKITPDKAITLSECFLTIPFHVACVIAAIRTNMKTVLSIKS